MFASERPHRYSIFTHSVGANVSGHSLIEKIEAIAAADFDGIELFQDDLDAFAQSSFFQQILEVHEEQQKALLTPPESPAFVPRRVSDVSSVSPAPIFKKPSFDDDLLVRTEFGNLVIGSDNLPMTYNAHGICTATEFRHEMAAASYIASYCASLGLKIYSLQPLRDFEGWVDPKMRHLAVQRVRSRFEVMKALGTEMLLICSSNIPAPKTTGDIERIAEDLALIGDLAAKFGPIAVPSEGQGRIKLPSRIKIGYEALSWGAHVNLWADAWRGVQLADRPNIGLILDSFNTLGRQYADPCTSSGVVEDVEDPYANLMDSLKQIGKVPSDKIFFLQIGDARKMPSPLTPSPNPEEPRPARMIWSRGNRLFPCERERGAFLPVREFVEAVVRAGYRGPWSIEVFNSSLFERCRSIPTSHARRARDGLDKLVEEVYA